MKTVTIPQKELDRLFKLARCNFEYNHEAGCVFYEKFDLDNAEVIEDLNESKVPVILR